MKSIVNDQERIWFCSKPFVSFVKSLKGISGEWLVVICWSFCLFAIFIIKYCVELSLICFGTLKYDWEIKVTESFLPLVQWLFDKDFY